jgi:hypothetical protein
MPNTRRSEILNHGAPQSTETNNHHTGFTQSALPTQTHLTQHQLSLVSIQEIGLHFHRQIYISGYSIGANF